MTLKNQEDEIKDQDEYNIWISLISAGNPFGAILGFFFGTLLLRGIGSLKNTLILADLIGIIGSVVIVL